MVGRFEGRDTERRPREAGHPLAARREHLHGNVGAGGVGGVRRPSPARSLCSAHRGRRGDPPPRAVLATGRERRRQVRAAARMPVPAAGRPRRTL